MKKLTLLTCTLLALTFTLTVQTGCAARTSTAPRPQLAPLTTVMEAFTTANGVYRDTVIGLDKAGKLGPILPGSQSATNPAGYSEKARVHLTWAREAYQFVQQYAVAATDDVVTAAEVAALSVKVNELVRRKPLDVQTQTVTASVIQTLQNLVTWMELKKAEGKGVGN